MTFDHRKTFAFAFVVLALAVLSGTASAEWTGVGKGNSSFNLYADPSTIDREADLVRMSDLADFKLPRVAGGLNYLSIKSRHEYNCRDRKSRILSFTWYSKNMGNGVAVHTDDEPFEWESVQANTTSEALWKLACGGG